MGMSGVKPRSAVGGDATSNWECHFCGDTFAQKNQASKAHALLVRHIKHECPAVPEATRERYRGRCPGGNCDF